MKNLIPKIDPYPEGYILEWLKNSPIPDGWELLNDKDMLPKDEQYDHYIYIIKKVTEK